MALNPMQVLKLKDQLKAFTGRHPGFTSFVRAIRRKGLPEDSILDLTITTPDGKTMSTNLRLSAEDIAFVRTISELGK